MSRAPTTESDGGSRTLRRPPGGCDGLDALRRELEGFRVRSGPLYPGFELKAWLDEVSACRLVKENARRRVYFLQTPLGGYFFKFSLLVRPKDRRRHFLLPARKWAEWRNLHRLHKAGIAAARPVAAGYRKKPAPRAFFLLTEQVPGSPGQSCRRSQARLLGEYAAGLHAAGVLHADLNRNNFLIADDGRPRLIDVQEVFFLPWVPGRLRLYNLGSLIFHLAPRDDLHGWTAEFLQGYNSRWAPPVGVPEALRCAARHRQRWYRSRSKRCCRDSSQFEVVCEASLRGYRRRDFGWGREELHQALAAGKILKADHVRIYRGVCIKEHRRQLLHRDRCLASWKMSQALTVRGIAVPRALAYYVEGRKSWFLAAYLEDSRTLNDYLSNLTDWRAKRRALKKLALLVRKYHDGGIWQHDFKSSNILCRGGEFFMVDLDAVRIRRLGEERRIVNLAQLNASLSHAITLKDRLRFLHYYSGGRLTERVARRALYRRVWAISRTKNTAIYNLELDRLLPAATPSPGRRRR